jgi:prepilin-type N-terminal cleavage/methylation domain-containing protein
MSCSRQGLTLIEVLVVLVLITLLVLVFAPRVQHNKSAMHLASMRDQGVGIYKALFALNDAGEYAESSLFPTSNNAYATSTEYFKHLINEGVFGEDMDFSLFAAPGQRKARTMDPADFNSHNNGWNVVLDITDASSMTPFLFSRNFLHADTHLPKRSHDSLAGKLGEPDEPPGKLRFNTQAMVVINKIGAGQILKKADLKLAKNFNNTDGENAFLKP